MTQEYFNKKYFLMIFHGSNKHVSTFLILQLTEDKLAYEAIFIELLPPTLPLINIPLLLLPLIVVLLL